MDRGDDAERPLTTRIGPAGGAGRGFSTAVVLVALALVVAVLKPWDWLAPPAGPPGREGAAISTARPATSPTVAPTSASRDWTGAEPRVACVSGTRWLAVVDQVNGPTDSRSWTRLDLVPATDPLDADRSPGPTSTPTPCRESASVPRTRGGWRAGGSPAAEGDLALFQVRAWRIRPASVAAGPQSAAEIAPALVSGGTPADRGALYGPPISPNVRRVDLSANAAWPVGTYVFQVEHTGAEPAGRRRRLVRDRAAGAVDRAGGGSTPAPGVPPTAPATPRRPRRRDAPCSQSPPVPTDGPHGSTRGAGAVDLGSREDEADDTGRGEPQPGGPVGQHRGEPAGSRRDPGDARDERHGRHQRQGSIRPPAVVRDRPVAGRVGERDEGEGRQGGQEDEDPRALERVPLDRRNAVAAAGAEPGKEAAREHEDGAGRRDQASAAERATVERHSGPA